MKRLLPLADVVASPFVLAAGVLLRLVRQAGVQNLPASRKALHAARVFPVRDHYYEPQFDFAPDVDFASERSLPGINWNERRQLELLDRMTFAAELAPFVGRREPPEYGFDNNQFGAGDGEYWYQLIRALKPRRIFEIGSGNSTLVARKAIERNRQDEPTYSCKHVCVEPYEMPWLEKTGVTVVRQKVEDLRADFFADLQSGDVLFIDSSHVIRPHGDVLCEYLQILPTLNVGVIVHVHDIFSPRNYPKQWLVDDVRFWNEQYLLEAFLTHNDRWEVVGALNYLQHRHREKLAKVTPHLPKHGEPGSFYLRRVS